MSIDELVAVARSYVGVCTKFQPQGRTIEDGFDCGGFLIRIGKDIGAVPDEWDWTAYEVFANTDQVEECLSLWCEPVDPPSATVGDIVLMKVGDREVRHMGILTCLPDRRLGLIQCKAPNGVVESGFGKAKARHIYRAYRVKGLSDLSLRSAKSSEAGSPLAF